MVMMEPLRGFMGSECQGGPPLEARDVGNMCCCFWLRVPEARVPPSFQSDGLLMGRVEFPRFSMHGLVLCEIRKLASGVRIDFDLIWCLFDWFCFWVC